MCNYTSVQCGVHPRVDKRFIPVIITFFVTTLIIVLLRVAARLVSKAQFWYDDYFNFAAFLTMSIYTLTDLFLANRGFGVDIWAVPQQNISYLLRAFLIASILYLITRGLIRVSILLFYKRIFRTPRATEIITWTLAVNVAFTFAAFFPILFQCSPVDYLWLQWDGTHKGRCIHFRTFVWIVTSLGIVLDFWAVFIASVFVARLQLPWRKKILVSSMFAVGLIAIAFSIARLPYINQFTGHDNPTINWVPITVWSALENYIGVICACLPSLPALVKPLSSKIKTRTSTKKSNLSSSYASQGTHFIEYEMGPRRYATLHEMTPSYAEATNVAHGRGQPDTDSSFEFINTS
ncbi:hypothetical protein GGR57DRAFT_509450 [Xylariaceae sp. FL1272]|nr:hypothetical protein GGR57DRAFT_509450 [Xylariaceae sp. FL1272]